MSLAVQQWRPVARAEDVASGSRGVIKIEVDLGGGKSANLFQYVVRGRHDGPTFFLLAGQHGVELNGCAAVESFVNLLDPEELSGCVLAVPVANPLSTAKGEQYPDLGPDIENNMNRIWPGRPDGSPIERLAHAIWTRGLSECDWCLDMHSWNRAAAPAALFSRESEALMAFGRASGLLFLNITDPLPKEGYTRFAPTVARRRGRAIGCCVELSGQFVIYPEQVAIGRRVLGNLLRHAKMLPGEPHIPRQINLVGAEPVKLFSPSDALIQPLVPLGEPVGEGEAIARLWRFDIGQPELLRTPVAGGLYQFGALDQIQVEKRYDRGSTSAVRAGEHVATIYPWQD